MDKLAGQTKVRNDNNAVVFNSDTVTKSYFNK